MYFKDEGVTYLNSVCKTYFGTGDEYTIKNWKKFNMTNWDEEKEGKIAALQVFDEEEISRNRPMDIPEFNEEDDLPAEERTGKKSTSTANDVLDGE